MRGRASPLRFDFARNVDAGSYLESFLVSGVASILVIRLYLEMTDYPRLGGGGLHIAHMLWGGLLMLVAIVLLLAFLGKRVKRTAAILGGVGFGAFIDELGKFITSDNNYFFQPTVGLIYIIFILLFLLFRQIGRGREPSRQELLVNAADMVKEVILDGARSDEIAHALTLLERSGSRAGVADALREAILSAARAEEVKPSLPARLAPAARRAYNRLADRRSFHRAVVLIFAGNAAATLLAAGSVLVAAGPAAFLAADNRSFATAGHLLASIVTTAMTIVGVARLASSHLAAYRWFKRSILVSIFLGQVFLFFQSQFAALGGLMVNLVLLSGLNTMLRAEYARREAALVGRSRGAAAAVE